jgi:hypothetical protein
MQAWGDVIRRATAVQAWAEQALPAMVAGKRVLVDEFETSHVHDKLETNIHVLASPPWSMRVLKPLEEVTQENVSSVMALAQLCQAYGIPSVS